MFDAIVAGSGPAGTAAARALAGRNVLVLDIGSSPPAQDPLEENLYRLRQRSEDLFPLLIGSHFESLRNLRPPAVSLKLKAPATGFVIENWERVCPVRSSSFHAVVSTAAGGLANSWGAGVYRFTAEDLAGFPIAPSDLSPFYDDLGKHMGISGADDDLGPEFGQEPELQPPLRLSTPAAKALQRYERDRAWYARRGIRIGRSRLAVLTREHQGRRPYRYRNFEFFETRDPAIYNPVFTLEPLIGQGAVQSARGYAVESFREHGAYVEVFARQLASGMVESFFAKKLLLAAGTLATSRIVLQATGATGHKLPILDNPMTCIPLIDPGRIGCAFDPIESSLAQLNLIYRPRQGGPAIQASLYGATGPLRTDVLFDLPFCIRGNLAMTRALASALILAMFFEPAIRDSSNYLTLNSAGELEVEYRRPQTSVASEMIPALRRLKFWTARSLCQYPPMGASLHYAGTLPMRADPAGFETNTGGGLRGFDRVHVVDGACFSALPAKNLTYTIMANAARIASAIRRELP